MSVTPRVSLVATVLNELDNLPAWLGGLERQRRAPDDVVIVDGGSDDGTWEALRAWAPRFPVRLERCPGVSIAEGRNVAIEAARGDIIAVTDAGTVADADWLARLVDALADPRVDVAAGFFRPALGGRWDRALAATTLPDLSEIRAGSFLPSSRSVAFRRTWFDAGLRYPDWLDYCEDLVWDLAMLRAGARFRFVPDAAVSFRVRSSPGAHARQYRTYARGDGKAGLFARRHALRYATYLAGGAMLGRRRPWELLAGALLGLGYIRRPALRLWRWDRAQGRSVAATLALLPALPLIRMLGDGAKMCGYPAGLLWRRRRMGAVGWRTTWRRVTPDGRLWRPAALTRRSRTPTASPDA